MHGRRRLLLLLDALMEQVREGRQQSEDAAAPIGTDFGHVEDDEAGQVPLR
jgi:hypothetical protein